jgi:uncharacterized membrane protein
MNINRASRPSGGLRRQYRTELLGFLYFAFAIGTATQVSDVAVTSRTIRRTITAHGMVATSP